MQDQNLSDLIKKIINVLYLSGDEMSVSKIAEILSIKKEEVISIVPNLKLSLENAGLKLLENNDALCIVTHEDFSEILKSFTKYEIDDDLTPAALQTLTIIGYLENPSTSEISFVRGINSTLAVRTLMTKGLIEKYDDKRYTFSAEALKYLSISKKEDLPEYVKLNQALKEKLELSLNG
jgi:segregation and condensation protein B